jgi:hypothetical protein
MSDHRPAVSARGVLDGDPTALAGLCDLRGPAVVAYCDAVCGPAAAVDAAAAAFASFRATAAGATHPLAINPEALLLAKAREAAAAHAPDPSGGSPRPDDPLCPDVPRLLARAAQGALAPAERHHLRRHLARCVPCRSAQNAQREAERAYARPPSPTLPPITRQAVIAALRHAIPPAAPPAAPPTPAAASGARPGLAPPPAGGPTQAPAARLSLLPPHAPRSPADRPAGAPDGHPPQPEPGPGPGRVPPTPPTPPPAPRPEMPLPGSHVSGSPGPGAEAATGVIPVDQVAAALGYADHPAGPPPPADPAPAGRRLGLPRLAGTAIARLPRARVLAPVAVLVAALLVILPIAGVFSGGSHSPTPAPASSAAPPAVLDHSPAAHRARLRAAARRRAARARAARARKRAAAAPATGSTTPATGAAAPAGGSTPAGAPTAPAPVGGAPTTRILAAPAATAPPVNGAAPATSGGFRGD